MQLLWRYYPAIEAANASDGIFLTIAIETNWNIMDKNSLDALLSSDNPGPMPDNIFQGITPVLYNNTEWVPTTPAFPGFFKGISTMMHLPLQNAQSLTCEQV